MELGTHSSDTSALACLDQIREIRYILILFRRRIEIMNKINRYLLEKAAEARENAVAPLSDFYVGAAVLTPDGKVYTGANVELGDPAYAPLGICAERVAIFRAVAD